MWLIVMHGSQHVRATQCVNTCMLTLPALILLMIAQGTVTVRGRCCFSAQDAWIRNASLRDNVLMGQPWDYAKYWAIVDACALQPDLDQLVAGVQIPLRLSFEVLAFKDES